MRIQQQYPITEGKIKAAELQADINQIIATLNALTKENLNRSGNEFDFGDIKLAGLLDPDGGIDDSTDLQKAVTKKYLQEKIYDDFLSGTGTFHGHDNKALLDTILRNTTAVSSGTTDSATTDKLNDSTADFVSDGVTVDMIVYNSTEETYGVVSAVDSAVILSVSPDMMNNGDDYEIYPIPSIELLSGDPFNSYTISPKQKAALDEVQAAVAAFGTGTDRMAVLSDITAGVLGARQGLFLTYVQGIVSEDVQPIPKSGLAQVRILLDYYLLESTTDEETLELLVDVDDSKFSGFKYDKTAYKGSCYDGLDLTWSDQGITTTPYVLVSRGAKQIVIYEDTDYIYIGSKITSVAVAGDASCRGYWIGSER